MSGEMHYIPVNERRDRYLSTRDEEIRDSNTLLVIMFIVIIFGLSLLVHMFLEPAKAEEVTPKNDYPLTNAGTCMRLHDYGMEVRGAGINQVVELCKANGVLL